MSRDRIPAPSLAVGPTEPPLLTGTIGAALDRAAERWPDGLALVSRHQDIRLSWAELNAEAIDADGWMHSGDLATMDEAGYIRIMTKEGVNLPIYELPALR